MDSLISALVILVIGALITVLKKKGILTPDPGDEPTDTQEAPRSPISRPQSPSAPSPQRPRPVATSWEEELRRLLEGQAPTARRTAPPPIAPPPMPSSPPPLIRPVMMQPGPPPIVAPAPTVVRRPVLVGTPIPVAAPTVLPGRDLAALSQSSRAYERASQLDQSVGDHIGAVAGQHVLNTVVERRAISPEITQVTAMFKSPRGVRQAVLASIIFSAPKSLEEGSGMF